MDSEARLTRSQACLLTSYVLVVGPVADLEKFIARMRSLGLGGSADDNVVTLHVPVSLLPLVLDAFEVAPRVTPALAPR